MTLIQLKNVSVLYNDNSKKKIIALNDINIQINKSDFIIITGPSGSGKSTLLQVLGCISKPTSGHYYIDGHNISDMNDREIAKIRNRKIGFILQNFGLMSYRSVLDNVQIPLLFSDNKSTSKSVDKCSSSLKKLGMEQFAKRKVWELSGGEKQRVAIARAIVNEPDIILADEPTGALDPANKEVIMQILSDIHKEGRTIVMVTHDMSLLSYATRVVSLIGGNLTEE